MLTRTQVSQASRSMVCGSVLAGLAALAGAGAAGGALAGPIEVRVLVRSGASGPVAGTTIEEVSGARLVGAAAGGSVVFTAFLRNAPGFTSVTAANDLVLMRADGVGGVAELLLREGSVPPFGDGTGVVAGLLSVNVHRSGAIMPLASVSLTSGVYAAPLSLVSIPAVGAASVIVREGDTFGGLTGTLSGLVPIASAEEAIAGFVSGRAGAMNQTSGGFQGGVLFDRRGGVVNIRSTAGAIAPDVHGAPGTGTFAWFDDPTVGGVQPESGAASVLAVRANLSNAAAGTDSGVWVDRGFGLRQLLRAGDAAPVDSGAGAGVVVASVTSRVVFSNSGRMALTARLSGTGIDASNDGLLLTATVGNNFLATRAREGAVIADSGGATLGTIVGEPAINDAGEVVFGAVLGGTATIANNSAVVLYGVDGQLVILAREGMQVARMEAGTVYMSFGAPVISDTGAVAYTAVVTPAPVVPPPAILTSRTGLFVRPSGGDAGGTYPVVVDGQRTTIERNGVEVGASVFAISFEGPGEGGQPLVGDRVLVKATYKLDVPAAPAAPVYTTALLIGGPGCAADFDGSGVAEPEDLADYISAFFAGPVEPRADFDGDGAVTPDDLADFVVAFFTGC